MLFWGICGIINLSKVALAACFISPASGDFFITYKREKMKISNKGIECLKRQEGCVKIRGLHVIYDDKTGRPVPAGAPLPPGATIGYGHLVQPGEDFRAGLTEAQATHLLRSDIAVAERVVGQSVTAPLAQNQYDALVLLVYNIGGANFRKSTVLRYINNPTFSCAICPTLRDAWMAWNRSGGRVLPGLKRRRAYEFNLYTTGAY